MCRFLLPILFVFLFSTFSCHHTIKQLEADSSIEEPIRYGAIYIACEAPAWLFNFEDLFSCEQEHPAPSQLNPDYACAMYDIQKSQGEIELNFSENQALGRMVVRTKNSVSMEDKDGNIVNTLYINDGEPFYISKFDARVQLTVENVYVGGCFHELIRWESR